MGLNWQTKTYSKEQKKFQYFYNNLVQENWSTVNPDKRARQA